jgi:hypothetical protein
MRYEEASDRVAEIIKPARKSGYVDPFGEGPP